MSVFGEVVGLNRVCQSGGHDRRPEEADRGADGHALGQDRAQEMVRMTVPTPVEIRAVSVIIMRCVCMQVHHIQGPRVTGRLYPSSQPINDLKLSYTSDVMTIRRYIMEGLTINFGFKMHPGQILC